MANTLQRGRIHTAGKPADYCLSPDDRRSPLHAGAVELPQTSEAIARRIADAGVGLSPVSKVRDAIYATALSEIRALRGQCETEGSA